MICEKIIITPFHSTIFWTAEIRKLFKDCYLYVLFWDKGKGYNRMSGAFYCKFIFFKNNIYFFTNPAFTANSAFHSTTALFLPISSTQHLIFLWFLSWNFEILFFQMGFLIEERDNYARRCILSVARLCWLCGEWMCWWWRGICAGLMC